MADSRFDNVKYIYWLKVCMALLFAKEGLENLVDAWAKSFHDSLKKKLGDRVCETCSTDDLKRQWGHYSMKCSNNICNIWLEEIRSYLTTKKTIEWDNAHIQDLPKKTWECLKLFLPYGYKSVKQARDTDLAAILKLCINNRHFPGIFGGQMQLIEQVSGIRNKTMHSGTFELEEKEMKESINKILDLLKCHSNVSTSQDCINAVTKIEQLKSSDLEVSQHKAYEIRSLNARVEAINSKVDETCHSYDELKKEVVEQEKAAACVEEDVENIQTNYRDLNTSLQETRSEVEHMSRFLSKFIKTNGIEGVGLAGLIEGSKKLSSIDGDIKMMKTDICSLDNRVRSCEKRLDTEEKKTRLNEEELTKHKRKLDSIEYNITSKKVKLMDFEERKKDLQRDLLGLYQTHCGNISIAMMRPEMKGMLKDLYVQQTVRVVDHRGKKKLPTGELSSNQQTEKTTELRVRDILYSRGNQCKNVYITADAGYGKSTLCTYLVDIWCSAHSKETGQTKSDDEKVMQKFPILFYINLSGVCLDTQRLKSDQYARLIEEQWEFQFSVKDFLADRNCLIIADALDESPHGLPYRGKQNNSTILITSRPWKVEALRTQIDGKAIDKQIEIVGLCKQSYKKLSTRIIPILNSESPGLGRQNSTKFIQEMTQKGLKTFLEIPVLLLQMLRLWYDGKSIGNSQFEIYSNIVHHQIEINECKEPLPSSVSSKVERKSPLFCSFKTCCCKGYNDVMLKVAKLAFDTLFNKDKHQSMIFDHKQTEYHGLSNEDIQVCLKTGILTHEKLFGKITDRPEKLVQFVHKSHHEFFACVHLSTFDQLSQLPTDVNSVITNLDEALKLDKVLMFVAGMNSKMATELAAFIVEKCSGDSRIQKYRRTIGYSGHEGLVEQVQNLILAAEEESRKCPNMPKPKFRLDDISVDRYNVSRVLSSLPCLEISHLASIMMQYNDQVDAVMSHVQNTAGLQKVDLSWCTIGSRETAVKLVPQSLCVLYLHDVNLPHEAWTTLSHKLKTTKLRELELMMLICGSHGRLKDGKCGVTFDLTRQSHLEELHILSCNMSGWSLPTATPQLKHVYLWFVTIPGAMLSGFLRRLPQTVVRVKLFNVTVRPAGDIVDILDEMRGSRRVVKDSVEGRGEGELFVDTFMFSE